MISRKACLHAVVIVQSWEIEKYKRENCKFQKVPRTLEINLLDQETPVDPESPREKKAADQNLAFSKSKRKMLMKMIWIMFNFESFEYFLKCFIFHQLIKY